MIFSQAAANLAWFDLQCAGLEPVPEAQRVREDKIRRAFARMGKPVPPEMRLSDPVTGLRPLAASRHLRPIDA